MYLILAERTEHDDVRCHRSSDHGEIGPRARHCMGLWERFSPGVYDAENSPRMDLELTIA